ncbi:phage repressor protein C with HTH and peptisase S24 domain [Modicisalibacter xianhensis]|uniref:Phage repressor protein C with HTH and peptisase S24 domain n=1 Tax=Modicisalibacter xianhensis TaxID=442341 RepID=A0A4R8FYR2_9GAMM|nr:helix-turn-helix transcriptional regulator [Halomonas xianhensis]TDX30790.1 phage repressor protein C with HTH and peptisase S24 domain [Halomonas xianhensis]
MKEIAEIRLENARTLASQVGGTGAFAAKIDREPTQASRFMGKSPSKNIGDRMARHIEACFGKPKGWMDTEHSRNNELVLHETEIVEDEGPAGPDEVDLPCFREVEFDMGSGRTQVVENGGHTMRFSLARLSRAGVNPGNAACATAVGTSMEPTINDGSPVAIDKGTTHIIDGKIYALDHGGMLRIKRLYRLPLGNVRLVSDNEVEHPEEVHSLMGPDAPRIIGRVFWWENFD